MKYETLNVLTESGALYKIASIESKEDTGKITFDSEIVKFWVEDENGKILWEINNP